MEQSNILVTPGVKDLAAAIEEYAAKADQLRSDIEGLKEDITEKTNALQEATGIRDKELAEFNAEEKDMIQSITSLKGAVTVMSKAHGESALLQVKDILRHQSKRYRHMFGQSLSDKQRHAVMSLIQERSTSLSLARTPASGEIFGMLKQMKESFETNLAESKKEEEQAAKEYEARVKARTAEIQAVSETIGILTSDEANDAFTKSMSFMQRTSKRSSARREQASQLLRQASKKFKSVQLLNLASSARLDAFGKVIEQISATVDVLKQEQKDEVKDKDFCISELNANERETAKYTDQKEALDQKITDLTASIAELTESIATLKQEVTDTQVGMMKATEVRKAENADFNEVVADQRATQAILKKALDRLKETYGFMQEGESQPEQKTYAKSAGGGGAVAMIEEIVTESKDLEMKALGDEQASQAAYEGYVKDGNKAITAATTDIANKADAKAKADAALAEATGDRKSTIDTLLKLGEMAAEVHNQCDFLLKNFEARQSARTEEIDALNQAKQIFKEVSF